MGPRLGQPRGVSSVDRIWRSRPSSTEAFRTCPILSRRTGDKPMKPVVAAIAVMLLVQSTAGASSIAYMYTARTLERERPRFEQRIGELYRIISSLLGPQEQRAFADVKIEFPLIGTSTGTPLEFYTAGEVARASVFMPVFS